MHVYYATFHQCAAHQYLFKKFLNMLFACGIHNVMRCK